MYIYNNNPKTWWLVVRWFWRNRGCNLVAKATMFSRNIWFLHETSTKRLSHNATRLLLGKTRWLRNFPNKTTKTSINWSHCELSLANISISLLPLNLCYWNSAELTNTSEAIIIVLPPVNHDFASSLRFVTWLISNDWNFPSRIYNYMYVAGKAYVHPI